MPEHQLKSVAVIPDGNRRFAKKSGLALEAAYLAGFKKAGEFSKWAFEEKVKNVSYWALSLDNYAKRSQEELKILFKLMTKHMEDALTHPKFNDHECRIKFFGRRDLLPKSIQNSMAQLEEKTLDRSENSLNMGVAYSGREEVLEASKKLASDIAAGKISPQQVNESMFSSYLYTDQTPELIIRTGNVQRLSGFMSWQNAYSELYFSPKLWPEFTKPDFLAAKEFFETTEQRFGK
ncbi:di-trans,poly-cis-decaprenylcistransferase [Candidatus Micrarchaeota archaeon]|nr:di-trans,poly-cis-decaprenylcistransferase [Candidatus Micrarchaeota archaeon]